MNPCCGTLVPLSCESCFGKQPTASLDYWTDLTQSGKIVKGLWSNNLRLKPRLSTFNVWDSYVIYKQIESWTYKVIIGKKKTKPHEKAFLQLIVIAIIKLIPHVFIFDTACHLFLCFCCFLSEMLFFFIITLLHR